MSSATIFFTSKEFIRPYTTEITPKIYNAYILAQ